MSQTVPVAIKEVGPDWPFNAVEPEPSTHAVVCRVCECKFCFAISSVKMGGAFFNLTLYCPNCEAKSQLICDAEQLDAIEDEAHAGETLIRRDVLTIMDHLWVEHGINPEEMPPGCIESD